MNIEVMEEKKLERYNSLLHYTNYGALKCILKDKTFKFNSLKNVNDKFEKKRKGLETFTGTRYVFCLCHQDYEVVPFWYVYGGDCKREKVLLRFENFTNIFKDVIENSYVLDEHHHVIDCKNLQNGQEGLRIAKIVMFDMKYGIRENLDLEEYVSTESFIPTPSELMQEGLTPYVKCRVDTNTLGKIKTVNWEYEKETRLMCITHPLDKEVGHLFISVKEEIFRNLEIVVNPWADDKFVRQIEMLIQETDFSDDIKRSITVARSELDDMLVE